MKKYDEDMIATALGDKRPLPGVKRWLATSEGQRELAAYRTTLRVLREAYAHVTTPSPAPAVYYTGVDTPIGPVWLAATAAGLTRVSFGQGEASFVSELHRRHERQVMRSSEKLAEIVAQLEEYFAGRRRAFDLSIDLSRATPFQRRVLLATRTVPPGTVVSYGEIARRIAQPKASRAVGQALGRNPVPIVIPCHRIVAGGGRLGGYTGGLHIKKKLLSLEAA